MVPEIECQEIILMKSGKFVLFSVLLLAFTFSATARTHVKASPEKHKAGQEHAKTDEVERISVDELILMFSKKRPVTIIDVRNLDSYEEKIVGALQIPHDEVKSRLKEVPRDREIVTYCA
jgi:hypothetical protein